MAEQLLMVHADVAAAPAPAAPDGVTLRTWRPGDEQPWCDLVSAGQMGEEWTVDKAREELFDSANFDPDGCFFACDSSTDQPLATATAYPQRALGRSWPGLHMVATAPAARGRGLGTLVTAAVLAYWRDKGVNQVILTTDDWRTAAIAVYLKLGWRAVRFRANGEDHADRWRAVFDALQAPQHWRPFAEPPH